MQYIIYRSDGLPDVLYYRVDGEDAAARYLEASGAPAMYKVIGVMADGNTTSAVNGKVWLEKYRLDQLRRAALANTAPAWHDEADCVATVFAYLLDVPNDELNAGAVDVALTLAISGIVRYQSIEKETPDFLTVHDYVWALIRAKRTG